MASRHYLSFVNLAVELYCEKRSLTFLLQRFSWQSTTNTFGDHLLQRFLWPSATKNFGDHLSQRFLWPSATKSFANHLLYKDFRWPSASYKYFRDHLLQRFSCPSATKTFGDHLLQRFSVTIIERECYWWETPFPCTLRPLFLLIINY